MREILKTTAEKCKGDGACARACELLQSQGNLSPGDIAEALQNGHLNDSIIDFVLKCSLCGLCSEICPAGIDIPNMVRCARSDFMERGITDPESYRHMWVDHDWHAFSLYRNAYRMDDVYQDWFKETCDVLFFPGCMLANEGPDLVRGAAGWLTGQGADVGLSLLCCGAPLAEMGLTRRAENYSERLWRKIDESGARMVVTACPSCNAALLKTKPQNEIEVVSLFQLMADAGVRAPVIGSGTVTVHDSCTARKSGLGNHVRTLLCDYELKEMKHHGRKTICCGSGGIVSAVDPEICTKRADLRLNEMKATEAEMCITYCMSCAHRLAENANPGAICHILELVFEQKIDHKRFDEMAFALCEGESAEQSFHLLQNSKILDIGARHEHIKA